MSLLGPLRPDMTETKEQIQVGSKRLLFTTRISSSYRNLYIGGRSYYCLYVQIPREDGPLASLVDITTGSLPEVKYNAECSIEGEFIRGIDTTQILRILLDSIRKRYPHVRSLSFSDASYRTCDSGSTISLAEMSYITTGKTWYERMFGAYLDPESATLFSAKETLFQAMKTQMPWAIFRETVPVPDSAEELYRSSQTWQAFFGPLKDQMGVSEFCTFAAPWLHGFLQQFLPIHIAGLQYRMPIQATEIAYTIGPYLAGGGRSTRRRLRSPGRRAYH